MYYSGKLIASEIFEGDDERMVDENARNSFMEWLEFETIELDDKGEPKTIKIKEDIK